MQLNKQVLHLTSEDRALIKIVQAGLPIISRPYAEIAKKLNTSEADVISRLQDLVNNGAIKNYGVVICHQQLGCTENGMVVWDMPDDRIEELGICIGNDESVTFSYRRPRRLPDWPYNLFTMVHGSNRENVAFKVADMVEKYHLENIDHNILFSTRRFKLADTKTTPQNRKTSKAIKLQLIKH